MAQKKIKSLYDVIEDMIDESGKTKRQIAEEIGKNYNTLKNELNPNMPEYKLGIEIILPLMISTGRIDPIEYLAGRMGYKLVELSSASEEVDEKNCLMKAAEIGAACGKVADIVVTAMKNDGRLDKKELSEILTASVEAHNLLERFSEGAQKSVLKVV